MAQKKNLKKANVRINAIAKKAVTNTVITVKQDVTSDKLVAQEAVEALAAACKVVEKLARVRTDNKMTATRVNAVAKEIKELMKVLTVYC